MNIRRFAVLSASLALATVGCASSVDGASEVTATDASRIVGGVDAAGKGLDAIGSLVFVLRGPPAAGAELGPVTGVYPFCTASLIGPRAILTAEHCSGYVASREVAFAIGADARRAKRLVPVVDYDVENIVKGGELGIGSDVAVGFLGERVDDVPPLALGALKSSDVGQRFSAIGYGVQDNLRRAGTRKAGSITLRATEGRLFEKLYGDFDTFAKAAFDIPQLVSVFEDGDPTLNPAVMARLKQLWDSSTLISDYEALTGGLPGDVDTCYGDSGGPLVKRVDGKLTAFGVVSWGFDESRQVCGAGNVYATLGPRAMDLAKAATTWEDPCLDVSVKGFCEGDVAIRCADMRGGEGRRRKLVTDCANHAQTCGRNDRGQVACIDL